MEMDFGASEGMLVAGLSEAQTALLMSQGETEEHLVERAINALFKISAQHPGQRVIVVTHEVLIRSVLAALGQPGTSQVANGQCTTLPLGQLANYVSRQPLWH